jgi:hypothetical protein
MVEGVNLSIEVVSHWNPDMGLPLASLIKRE